MPWRSSPLPPNTLVSIRPSMLSSSSTAWSAGSSGREPGFPDVAAVPIDGRNNDVPLVHIDAGMQHGLLLRRVA
jgi:hypothetical protein